MKNYHPNHPGQHLRRDYMQPQGITDERLSHDLKVPLSTLQSILHENGIITEEVGEKLDLYFNRPMGYWRNMQVEFEEVKAPRPKPQRTKQKKTASGLKWTGLILTFLPMLLILVMLLLAALFDSSGSSLFLFLILASLVSWIPSILIGFPMWVSGVVVSKHHPLFKFAAVVLVLGIYLVCMVFTLPITLIIIGGLGFSFG